MTACQTIDRILARGDLHALFQPVADLQEGRIMGYEGLIRGPSDSPLHAPQKLLAEAVRAGCLFELDLLCRRVILARFAELGLQGRLFLNVNPDVLADRNAVHGMTLQILQEHGIAAEQVVIELTEQQPIHDYGIMREAVHHYRDMGFAIALDDLGAGYSSLRHWSELQPDYVKIDMHFVQNVHNDPVKRHFLHSIREIAHSLGTHLIAEGIETEAEYDAVRSLEIPYGQGYHFARPAASPPRELNGLVRQQRADVTRLRHRSETVAVLIRTNPTLTPEQSLGSTVARFQVDPALHSLPVIHEDRPVGIIRRQDILALYAQRFTRELHDRSPIRFFMKRDPLVVDQGQPLERLSETITAGEAIHDEFIITDGEGRYLGVGRLLDLLRRITALQVRYARYANPLTQLPGSVPVNEHVDRLIELDACFVVAYCDLDNFKPFNDFYGYARGDQVICALGEILRGILEVGEDFLGHIGGDDFILVLAGSDWHRQCRSVLDCFDVAVSGFYDERERRAGGIWSLDRQGQERFFPPLSLSIGVVRVQPGSFRSHLEISQRASEVKCRAKAEAGNSLFVDRRMAWDDSMIHCPTSVAG
ncbi:diguanylate cyclase (GGDEF) domain-containing protein [Ectothiorhodospira magna]|uniref:Diguanylate cyclase (GGDEF) domain-containing protein n=1 Tax=Ectothiorhodospira magna TaxID=867345 RepID=A0A1H9FYM1_9GAMM|nr:bifunctional diguanylate cyclase/phosphodiesterase [Ectothiorhodospira magna]SEQ42977.1 diguanylate cyclase (GGDEF) domain-containing protein [Ectothiorhodospira magna]